MSRRTVEKHLERIYQKLDVKNRTAVALLALTFISDYES
jgi:DNA-binding CsgD family transcriptional regulator